MEPALGELKRATEALLETTAQLKEFSREIAGTFDCSPPTYPDESLSLDIEHDGKVVGLTVVDSSGFLMQVGQSACNRELVTPPRLPLRTIQHFLRAGGRERRGVYDFWESQRRRDAASLSRERTRRRLQNDPCRFTPQVKEVES